MRQIDARRLTGRSLLWDYPGAVVDVEFDTGDVPERIVASWLANARAMLDELGWTDEETCAHRFSYGASLAISAPIDRLYAATEVVEWATAATLGTPDAETRSAAAARIAAAAKEESNCALLALEAAAAAHGVPFLSDDDEVSIGLGRGSATWPVDEIPESIDWDRIGSVPTAMITGTNGKTTTVRMLTRIVRAAGLTAGLSSTDWISVNDEIVDRGDYSGPGGARTVLRHPDVDVAILETARGGLLRRGLGIGRVDAALITNIGEDHLGDFGSRSIDELLDVKWVVTRALDKYSRLVLNADDPRLVEKAKTASVPLIWFSRDAAHPVIERHRAAGETTVTVRDGVIVVSTDGAETGLVRVDEIPVTMGGIAAHNVSNALGAVGVATALGLPSDAIAGGLASMRDSDNPGRCNLFHVDGVDVLLDFAHNPDGMAAIFDIAAHHPAKRRALCFAQAGDRTDEQIRELARSAWAIGLDRIVLSELGEYRRGREPGEVCGILRDALLGAGADEAQISVNELELQSLEEALDWAERGDLVIMLGLADQAELLAHLRELDSSGGGHGPSR